MNDRACDVQTLELGPMENLVYLIIDRKTRRAAVVDPAWEVDKIIEAATAHNAVITDIFLTHSHHDHINGIDEVREKYDARVHLLRQEAEFWGAAGEKPMLHRGGDRIWVGETEIEILHTPGHTPGSACYHVNECLLTGDTIFVWGCGRCDLKGGDPEQMYTTLRRIASDLPSDTIILPGHNYSDKTTTSLQEQIDGNPFFCFDDIRDFTRYRMVEHDRLRHSPYTAIPCAHSTRRGGV